MLIWDQYVKVVAGNAGTSQPLVDSQQRIAVGTVVFHILQAVHTERNQAASIQAAGEG